MRDFFGCIISAFIQPSQRTQVGGMAQWLGRRSLAGGAYLNVRQIYG